MSYTNETYYTIALGFIPSVGNITAQRLIDAFGSAEEVFAAIERKKSKVERVNENVLTNLLNNKQKALSLAEQEMMFIEKNNIKVMIKRDADYPDRLRQCIDAPSVIYGRGNFETTAKHTLAIVGTRNSTAYGNKITKTIVEDLVDFGDIQIISGLAAGIDTQAHQAAVNCQISTIGVLGHGLKYLYPTANRRLAAAMLEKGGVLTEFPSQTQGDPANFPRRNRIIAALSDAVLIVESREKGGALITAEIALSYNRDVLAVPGKVSDVTSVGCNNLIKDKKAALVTSAEDILLEMNWEKNRKNIKPKQLLLDIDGQEKQIIDALQGEELNIDQLCKKTALSSLTLTNALLSLELKGCIEALPGKRYKIC